jgi:Uncharacterized protein conserved in bacteria
MKTLKNLVVTVTVCLLIGAVCKAQNANITVEVKGIKDAKGRIMVAFGEQSKPNEMVFDMTPVSKTEKVVCVLKNVPVGTGNLYVYQDLNDNYQLDKDEDQIPVEPCYTREKVNITEGENKIKVKLINVKEMMKVK